MGTLRFTSKLKDITIPAGQAVSNEIDANGYYEDAECIVLYAPAVLAETCTIEVSDVVGGTFRTLTTLNGNALSDVAPPLAGKARKYTEIMGCTSFRLKAGVNVAADRVFGFTTSANE